jgi:hypothetical protein
LPKISLYSESCQNFLPGKSQPSAKGDSIVEKTKRSDRPIEIHYNKELEGTILKIRNPEIVYPLFFDDPDKGIYKVIKTPKKGILMNKV